MESYYYNNGIENVRKNSKEFELAITDPVMRNFPIIKNISEPIYMTEGSDINKGYRLNYISKGTKKELIETIEKYIYSQKYTLYEKDSAGIKTFHKNSWECVYTISTLENDRIEVYFSNTDWFSELLTEPPEHINPSDN